MKLNGVETNITREEALRLHREMWTDMQKELGDCPSELSRVEYKQKWCDEHGYIVTSSCFLCEYAYSKSMIYNKDTCAYCPINWKPLSNDKFNYCASDCRYGNEIFLCAPISEILALPERSE
jgi:hypothetical protein